MAVVMKFGGSSVGSAERIQSVAEIVKSRLEKKPIVVVSAMKGATDTIIESAEDAGKFAAIKEMHAKALKELGLPENLLENELGKLKEAIEANVGNVDVKAIDLLSSFGERLSVRMVAAYLNKIGIPAKAFDAWDLGLVTDSNFGAALPLPEAEGKIAESLKAVKEVAVVTGFIAKDANGEVTTLGRGGSDFTAAILGAAIDAEAIEIWTDVNGIMSANPKIVPEAKTIPEISFDEAAELAFFGAKVLHPKTIIPAVLKDVPVKVLNSFEPQHAGTTVTKSSSEASEVVKGISHKGEITLVNIHTAKMLGTIGFAAHVFEVLAKHKLDVDLIATSEINISFSVPGKKKDAIEKAVNELEEFSSVLVEEGKAIVSVVGKGVKQRKGFAGKVFSLLGENSINVETISQAAPELNLSFVVDEKDAEKVVQVLHREFIK